MRPRPWSIISGANRLIVLTDVAKSDQCNAMIAATIQEFQDPG